MGDRLVDVRTAIGRKFAGYEAVPMGINHLLSFIRRNGGSYILRYDAESGEHEVDLYFRERSGRFDAEYVVTGRADLAAHAIRDALVAAANGLGSWHQSLR